MKLKLIATDLDGTLLNAKGEVSALTRQVFWRAQQDGIRIVLATGRDLPYFSQVREAMHTDMYAQNFYIALNGALIVNCENGQEQRTPGFAPENVDPFLKLADAYDLEALCYTRSGRFRYAQPGFEQRRLDYLKQHGLSVEDNVEHPDAAEIVKLIFSLFLKGTSKRAIALYLNEHGVPSPSAYKLQKGIPVSTRGYDDPMWGARMIHSILTNPTYIGDLAQGRSRVKSYKVHEVESVPREEWVEVSGTHESIIDYTHR